MPGAFIKTLEFDLFLDIFSFRREWEAAHRMCVDLATTLLVEIFQEVLSLLHHHALSKRVRVLAAVMLLLGVHGFLKVPTVLDFVCYAEYV